jgi:hypothetical protein
LLQGHMHAAAAQSLIKLLPFFLLLLLLLLLPLLPAATSGFAPCRAAAAGRCKAAAGRAWQPFLRLQDPVSVSRPCSPGFCDYDAGCSALHCPQLLA